MAECYASEMHFDIDDLLREADGHPDLSEWEQGFVEGMKPKAEKYGGKLLLSSRQQQVFSEIRDKLGLQ